MDEQLVVHCEYCDYATEGNLEIVFEELRDHYKTHSWFRKFLSKLAHPLDTYYVWRLHRKMKKKDETSFLH